MYAPPSRTPFVGRQRELATLLERLGAAGRGEGSVVLIAGEPGIGKTRLVSEFVERARAASWQVLSGAAYDVEGMPPYLPFVEALQDYARICPVEDLQTQLGAGAAEIALLLPEVRRRLPHLPKSPPIDAQSERFRLFESVAEFLSTIARSPAARGLLLCLDDLHWADEAALLQLEHLARRLVETPLLIVATYRDTDLDAARPLASTLERFTRRGQGAVGRLDVERLAEPDVAALVHTLSGREPPASLVAALCRETEGNPFFVQEVFRHLAEEGRLLDDRGVWRADVRIGEVDVPRSVRLVIGRRLERVSDTCRRVLTLAAVIGPTFTYELLQAVTELDDEAVLDAIDEAERAHLVASAPADPHGRVGFAHELIRQTLLSDLSVPRRQRLHLRAAEALERLHAADLAPHAAELAGHYLLAGAAGDPAKAVSYARQAGAAAEAVFAFAQAVGHYEAALRAIELNAGADPLQRAELLLALGLAQEKIDTWRGADTLVQAADAARAAGRPDLVVRAVLGTANFAPPADERLVPILRELLDGLGTEDSPLRARLLAYLACQPSSGPLAQREPLFEEAKAIARRVRDAEALAYVIQAQRVGLTRSRRPIPEVWEITRRLAVEEAELANATANLSLAVSSHCAVLQNSMWLGCISPAEIDELIETHYRLGAELRQSTQIWHALALRAMKALLEGRLDDVEPLAREANATIQRFGPSPAGVAPLAVQLLLLHREQGRLAEAAPAFRAWAAETPSNPLWRPFLVLLAAELGEIEEARRHLDELGADGFAGIPHDSNWLATMALLAEVCATVGHTGHGQALYALLLPRAAMNVFPDGSTFYLGSASWHLGLLAAMFARHFEDALEMHEQIGARPMLAHTAREYGVMLLAHGRRGDAARARELLLSALRSYQDLGMATYAGRTRALLDESPAAPSPPPAPAYPDGLSEREVDVLRLIAAGRSNREIAEALVISYNTVERHINHIFAKTAVANRVELATYAHRHGLAD